MTLNEAKEFVWWLVQWAFWGILISAGVSLAYNASPIGRDSTDTATNRSGMRLYTDAATGCQYLGQPQGGLTPRLDESGRQVCVQEVK